MKILFIGITKGNNGPSNVNKGIVQNLTKHYWYAKSRNKYVQLLEALGKCLFCDVIVVSGVSKQGQILTGFAKLIGKKAAFIMHGCAEYEVQINHQTIFEDSLRQEQFLLEKADLLLPVSKKFRKWVCDRYPQYANKTKYLYNGIDKTILTGCEEIQKKKGSIAATGADRGVKNNIVVARAVEEMAGKAKLTVYGAIYHGAPKCFEHTRYTGVIAHADFMRNLRKTELFVQNSIYEPFSLAIIEALMSGCSILISEIVGVSDLLELEESDIIHDPMDVQEIRKKIEYLQEHPNNERIMSKLDLDEYSYQKSVERLEGLCRELLDS